MYANMDVLVVLVCDISTKIYRHIYWRCDCRNKGLMKSYCIVSLLSNMCSKAVKPQPKSTSFKLTAWKPFSCCEILLKLTTLHIIPRPQLEHISFSKTLPETEWVTPQLPSICVGNRAWPTTHPCHCHSLDSVRNIHKDVLESSRVSFGVSKAQPHQKRYRTPTVATPIQRKDCCHQFCKQ